MRDRAGPQRYEGQRTQCLRSRSASLERQLKDEYDRGYTAGRQTGYRYNVKEKRANAAHRRIDKLEQRVEDIEDMMG